MDRLQHVLIVEDEPDVREVVQAAFEFDGGFRVTSAADGGTAHRVLEHERPDVAILDVVLPGVSGIELAEYASTLGIPVVLMTGDLLVADRLEAFGRLYLRKPFRLQELIQKTRQAIELSQETRRTAQQVRQQMVSRREEAKASGERLRDTIDRLRDEANRNTTSPTRTQEEQ